MHHRLSSLLSPLVLLATCSLPIFTAEVQSGADLAHGSIAHARDASSLSLVRRSLPELSSGSISSSSSNFALASGSKDAQSIGIVKRDVRHQGSARLKRQTQGFLEDLYDVDGLYEDEVKRMAPRFVGRSQALDLPFEQELGVLSNYKRKVDDVPYVSPEEFIKTYRKSDPYFMGKRSADASDDDSDSTFPGVFEDDDLFEGQGELFKRSAPRFIGKRHGAPRFVGKRAGAPRFVGKRGAPRFVGKRAGAPRFVGKRKGAPRFVGKRAGAPRFVGKRAGAPRFVGKRDDTRFVLKRAGAPRFVGKRGGAPRFVGKRQAPRFIGKRRAPRFVGKRDSSYDQEFS